MRAALGIGPIDFSDASLRLLGLLVVYVLFTFFQRAWRRFRLLNVIALQLNLLVLTLLALVFLDPVFAQVHRFVRNGFAAAAVFLGIIVGLKILDVLLFDLLAQWRKRPQVPLVVRDIGRWVVSLVALVWIVRAYFPGVNLNVLAVSSLVVGYIVGNATQDTLGNLIAGLALNTERPFQIGDWVTVGGHTGAVVDTTWRATRLRTKADDYVVIPNASIAREPILNFSRPTRNHGCYLSIGVSYDTPPNKARSVILDVLQAIPEICREPAPSVFLTGYGDFSINFTIKFFIEDYVRLDPIQSGVMDRLWYAFRREGISIPFPVQEQREFDAVAEKQEQRAADQEAILQLLAGVDLFQSLSPTEQERLATGVRLSMYARGEKLCRQDEEGSTFYVIRSGQVSVSVTDARGTSAAVAQLGAGAFFGEMSLLTGEKRSATVTAETDTEVLVVSKPVFSAILQANAELAGKLAAVLEKRAAARQAKVAALTPGVPVATYSSLLARIRHFFALG
jgi:small-conductance mechanosensitive channel/CRP-like cAMP-binding protein